MAIYIYIYESVFLLGPKTQMYDTRTCLSHYAHLRDHRTVLLNRLSLLESLSLPPEIPAEETRKGIEDVDAEK